MILREGGYCQIGIKICDDDAWKLGQFKVKFNKQDYKLIPVISLGSRLPASGRDYYEETLSNFAKRMAPFVTTGRKAQSVGLSMSSTNLSQISTWVDSEVNAISKCQTPDPKRRKHPFPARPKIPLIARLSATEAPHRLEAVLKEYEKEPGMKVIAESLALRRHSLREKDTVIEGPTTRADFEWKTFPFSSGD